VWGLSFGEQMDAFGQICHAFKENISLMPLGKIRCLILWICVIGTISWHQKKVTRYKTIVWKVDFNENNFM